ncbi:MAG: universal stress protein [Flavobacteriales bacterium]|nr:universal stress protein [Flavobacteriales bacterium]
MPAPTSSFRHIFHPTDLSHASAPAFHHALALAVAARAKLTVMHVAGNDRIHRNELPGVRETLQRWGHIGPVDSESELASMGLAVRKVISKGLDPVKACLDQLVRHPAQLVVLSTGQHQGHMRWLERSVSEELMRGSQTPTLFLPHGVVGWVDPMTGRMEPPHTLITTCNGKDLHQPWKALMDLFTLFRVPPPDPVILHVKQGNRIPSIGPLATHLIEVEGPVIPSIVRRSAEMGLLVMGTEGPHGIFDAMRGTTTEQVLRQLNCPLLAVPLTTGAGG